MREDVYKSFLIKVRSDQQDLRSATLSDLEEVFNRERRGEILNKALKRRLDSVVESICQPCSRICRNCPTDCFRQTAFSKWWYDLGFWSELTLIKEEISQIGGGNSFEQSAGLNLGLSGKFIYDLSRMINKYSFEVFFGQDELDPLLCFSSPDFKCGKLGAIRMVVEMLAAEERFNLSEAIFEKS